MPGRLIAAALWLGIGLWSVPHVAAHSIVHAERQPWDPQQQQAADAIGRSLLALEGVAGLRFELLGELPEMCRLLPCTEERENLRQAADVLLSRLVAARPALKPVIAEGRVVLRLQAGDVPARLSLQLQPPAPAEAGACALRAELGGLPVPVRDRERLPLAPGSRVGLSGNEYLQLWSADAALQVELRSAAPDAAVRSETVSADGVQWRLPAAAAVLAPAAVAADAPRMIGDMAHAWPDPPPPAAAATACRWQFFPLDAGQASR